MSDLFPHKPVYLKVALSVPLRRSFDYLPPQNMAEKDVVKLQSTLQPGIRVLLPFGNKTVVGLLLAVVDTTEVPTKKLKAALEILDQQPVLIPSIFKLALWAASYYQHPMGDALFTALPALLRQGEKASLPTQRYWRLTTHGKGLPEGALKRSPKQSELLSYFQRAYSSQQDLSQAQLKELGFSTPRLKILLDKDLIESFEQEESGDLFDNKQELLGETPLPLNEEQAIAVEDISASKSFHAFLLEGVTGSGKTEVYLSLIEKQLQAGKQALVLIPEIGLTPQMVSRFQRRFNRPVALLHSGLNNRQRLTGWLQAKRNLSAIVIGTRSSVFTPMPNLGIIIVDEEHDGSYKQQDNFRYSARDIAIVRAQHENVPIVLGSATPSLETLHNAIQGRYGYLRLTERAGGAKVPSVTLLDTSNKKLEDGFAPELTAQINDELNKNNQVLLFLNRRGFSSTLICGDCSWMASCSFCDVRTTVHKKDRQLRCHHCGFQEPIPEQCPHCFGRHLDYLGQGTQRSEESLVRLFPNRKILRIDRDNVSRKGTMDNILEQINSGEPLIMVGTQMVAKGHHFPDVTLVVILDADGGIFSTDFRGAERMGQLIVQVSGRAGRAKKPGRVIIQSQFCDHPIFQTLVNQGYEQLARQILSERQATDLPPYLAMAIIRTETKAPQEGFEFMAKLRQVAEQVKEKQKVESEKNKEIFITGPLPSLMEKRAGYFRHELLFRSNHRPTLQHFLAVLALEIEKMKEGKKYRWAIDVDPL